MYAGPVNSTYGEVFWTSLPTVKLPDDIVKRFKGKGMAVVGFEVDQVRKGAGPNGEDVSVPINCAYNHHYGATLLGSGSSMKRVPDTIYSQKPVSFSLEVPPQPFTPSRSHQAGPPQPFHPSGSFHCNFYQPFPPSSSPLAGSPLPFPPQPLPT